MRGLWTAAAFVAAVLILPRPIAPQAVSGRVVASESGGPLPGAFLRLYDEDGRQRNAVLADSLGRFHVQAPRAGLYSVLAEFIGRETVEMGTVELREGLTVQWSPSMPPKPVEVEGVAVGTSSRCVHLSEEGSSLAELWEEVKKALEVTAWTAAQRLYRYDLVTRRRELEIGTRRVMEEQSRQLTGLASEPFVSPPARDLVVGGFVRKGEAGASAYAPDARLFLSDIFLREYCFRLGQREAGLLGLSFEPIRERRVSDISGVMWVDTTTAELRSVVFTYRKFPEVSDSVGLGGRVVFARLPTGAWIVREWAVEVPIWADVGRPGQIDRWDQRLVGILEEAGEVLEVVAHDGDVVMVAERATVTGAVFDSIRGSPLSSALVRLRGTGYGALTGANGTFHLTQLPGGRYSLDITHPRLDSLGLSIDPVPVELVVGDTIRVNASVPRAIDADGDRALAVWGEVLDYSGAAPVEGAHVSLLDSSGTAVRAQAGNHIVGTVEARESGSPMQDVVIRIGDHPPVLSDARGRFTILGLQPGRHRIEVEFLGREPLRDTLVIDATTRVAVRIVLSEAPIELDSLVVEVESRNLALEKAGFYNRRDESGISGWRIDQEGIEASTASRVSDLLNAVPGAFLMYPGSPPGAAVLRVNRPGNRFRALQARPIPGCEPTVYVDGLIYQDSRLDYPVVKDINFLPLSVIAGIEVYTGLTAPARFDANGCGVIVIWTRGY